MSQERTEQPTAKRVKDARKKGQIARSRDLALAAASIAATMALAWLGAHLITGLLLLFGFNLHETHSRFYFANSFIDFWRRINIYWKDFMLKIFYYPAYFRLRRFGNTPALVLATISSSS